MTPKLYNISMQKHPILLPTPWIFGVKSFMLGYLIMIQSSFHVMTFKVCMQHPFPSKWPFLNCDEERSCTIISLFLRLVYLIPLISTPHIHFLASILFLPFYLILRDLWLRRHDTYIICTYIVWSANETKQWNHHQRCSNKSDNQWNGVSIGIFMGQIIVYQTRSLIAFQG